MLHLWLLLDDVIGVNHFYRIVVLTVVANRGSAAGRHNMVKAHFPGARGTFRGRGGLVARLILYAAWGGSVYKHIGREGHLHVGVALIAEIVFLSLAWLDHTWLQVYYLGVVHLCQNLGLDGCHLHSWLHCLLVHAGRRQQTLVLINRRAIVVGWISLHLNRLLLHLKFQFKTNNL